MSQVSYVCSTCCCMVTRHILCLLILSCVACMQHAKAACLCVPTQTKQGQLGLSRGLTALQAAAPLSTLRPTRSSPVLAAMLAARHGPQQEPQPSCSLYRHQLMH